MEPKPRPKSCKDFPISLFFLIFVIHRPLFPPNHSTPSGAERKAASKNVEHGSTVPSPERKEPKKRRNRCKGNDSRLCSPTKKTPKPTVGT